MGSIWFEATAYAGDGTWGSDLYLVLCCFRHFRGIARQVMWAQSMGAGVRQTAVSVSTSTEGGPWWATKHPESSFPE